ncbi:ATP-binding cassette domain-containing protein [Asanoa iriomotensis]|uniref:Daunorubicin resistance protein DrrA family ABC transporter ATP-binding protein n=1 Tax=Asanoa iriomotensis TaxID=234613 RepID=A0ABQ4BUX9_9ACTN|nr:ATP-binding cassette domain-containing protein [Asanoa iriomotensis]GIF54350.1 daunorubicin resistance protein DrrA family ABC transporter ATP-binding protein [Asanoa iriomotensis]
MDAIQVHGVSKSYGSQRVLDGIDLTVPAGTVFGLLGPNGAGKTTLVRILATLVRPDAGRASVMRHDVVSEAFEVRRKISLTGQYAAVDELQTGRENLVMVGRLCRLGRRAAGQRAVELLERFDLAEAGRKLVKTYSGGMRRRLDLAMSLVTAPPVIFLDEPTTGLDPRSRQQMWSFVRSLAAGGSTVFLTTQYLEEADQLADRIMLIDHGVAVADGTAASLKVRVGGERVELEFASAAALALAVADLDVPASGERSVTVATTGTAAEVRELLQRMDKVGATVDKVAIHRPTLDDVFFALTGGNPR